MLLCTEISTHSNDLLSAERPHQRRSEAKGERLFSCVCFASCGVWDLLVQRRLQHQSSSRFPGVTRVHGPEPGAGSAAVSVELQAARRGSEDRPDDGGVRPEILSLQPRSVSKHGSVGGAPHLKHPKMSTLLKI